MHRAICMNILLHLINNYCMFNSVVLEKLHIRRWSPTNGKVLKSFRWKNKIEGAQWHQVMKNLCKCFKFHSAVFQELRIRTREIWTKELTDKWTDKYTDSIITLYFLLFKTLRMPSDLPDEELLVLSKQYVSYQDNS